MKKVRLENDCCLVRSITSEDKTEFMRVYQENRERSDNYSGIRDCPRLYHSEEYIEDLWQDFLKEEDGVYMIVCRKNDNAHIANCSFHGFCNEMEGQRNVKHMETAEEVIEIRIDMDFSFLDLNEDIGAEILKLLTRYLHTVLPDKKIQIRTDSDNQPYRNMIGKAGGILMREEPTVFEGNAKALIRKLEKNGSGDTARIIRDILSGREAIHVEVYEMA